MPDDGPVPDPTSPDGEAAGESAAPRPARPRHAGSTPPRRRRGGLLGHNVILGGGRRRGPARADAAPRPVEAETQPEPADDPARPGPADGEARPGAADDAPANESVSTAGKAAGTEPTSSVAEAVASSEKPSDLVTAGASNDVSSAAPSGRQLLAAALRRPGRGQILIAVLLLVFGVGLVTQLRLHSEGSAYANARREDLIQILDGLTNENRRLETELGELESTRTSLQSGADAQRVAREEASRRIEQLSILAGLIPVEGPGIRMVISDPNNAVTAQVLLDAVQELRDAGAEVIEINDSIRLVASSWFGQDSRGLIVDGMVITRPIVIEAIGDPHSLAEGANFRGGIVSEITSAKIGGSVDVTEQDTVEITSLHAEKKNQYARPASPQPS